MDDESDWLGACARPRAAELAAASAERAALELSLADIHYERAERARKRARETYEAFVAQHEAKTTALETRLAAAEARLAAAEAKLSAAQEDSLLSALARDDSLVERFNAEFKRALQRPRDETADAEVRRLGRELADDIQRKVPGLRVVRTLMLP